MYTIGNSPSNSWDRQTAIASCKEYGPGVVVSKREGEGGREEREREREREEARPLEAELSRQDDGL